MVSFNLYKKGGIFIVFMPQLWHNDVFTELLQYEILLITKQHKVILKNLVFCSSVLLST